MEKYLIFSPPQLRRRGAVKLAKNAKVYLGDEFCFHKQPSFADFSAVARQTGNPPVLLSSLLNESAFESFSGTLAEFARKAPGTEVVVNDIGLLRYIDEKHRGRFRITLGRLMTYYFDSKPSQIPGTRIYWGAQGKNMKTWEKKVDTSPVSYLKKFLERYSVERIETDRPDLVKKYAEGTGVKISFHCPLRLMAVTWFCPFAGGIVFECKSPCGDRLLRLNTRKKNFPLFCKGNAYFVENRPIKHPRVDRLVETSFVRSPGFRQFSNKYTSPDAL